VTRSPGNRTDGPRSTDQSPRREDGEIPAGSTQISPAGERLQKVLAHAGVASRRHAEQMIVAGRVTVNGETTRSLGVRVSSADLVAVDSRPIRRPEALAYFAVHKPTGVVTTVSDPEGRRTVVDMVSSPVRVYPVGRLDADSEGLLLLTNDGELANRLIRPSYGVEKEYQVQVAGCPNDEALRALSEGVELADGLTSPARVSRLREETDSTWLGVVISEGRKRQIRRMCTVVGHPVRRLIRTRIGPIHLTGLALGRVRRLRDEEVRALRREAGLGAE
jgi:23S rRNA pseudouridine2605 synthase